jgi:hypothetical protein
MELKDFVRETIQQIVEGVSEAQSSIEEKGAIINPSGIKFFKDGKWSNYHHAMPQNVEFDVGLTAIDKSGSSEGIGVFLGSVNLGKKNDSGTENVAVTKVKFSVPLVLPQGVSLKE